MGRPRKHPLPDNPVPVADSSPLAPVPAEPEEDFESWDSEDLVAWALDHPRFAPAPWCMVVAVGQSYRDNVRADDDQGKAHARACATWLKRRTHPELHPGCQRVTITVPVLKRADGRGGIWYVTINERKYVGKVTEWECTARTILRMVFEHRQMEAERMSEDRQVHPTSDLDTGVTIAERAAAIQRA